MLPCATARSIYYPPKTFFHHHPPPPHSTVAHYFYPPSFIPLYRLGYRFHNHLPPLPSEYVARLIQPVLLRDPFSIYTREKVAGICPLLSSCTMHRTFGNCNRPPVAHSNSTFLSRMLPHNGNRISSDQKNGCNVADKMQTIYFWNNPKISTHWNFNSVIIIAINEKENLSLWYFMIKRSRLNLR